MTGYERNRQAMRRLYERKSGILVTCEWYAGVYANQLESLDDREREFEVQLARYRMQADAAAEGFANVPTVYFDFGRVAWLMALAYGCPMIRINGLVNAEPLYRTLEEAEAFRPIPRIWERGLYPEIFSRIEAFQERHPEIPITISDNQSPNDVLTSILKSDEAMVAMVTDGDRLHEMLGILTDSIIEVNRRMETVIRNFAGFSCDRYLPFGMHVSDDNAAFLSPEAYAEFSVPYAGRLADAFGGLAYHCCMGQQQNLALMASTRGFLGFDAMPDFNPVDRILSAIGGKGVWNVCNHEYATLAERKTRIPDEAWFRDLIDRARGRCGLLLNVYHPERESALRLAASVLEHAERTTGQAVSP